MFNPFKIKENLYWVGAIDWNLRSCGSYNTPYGTTYNSYLILDKKIALIDTVKPGFEDEMFSRIREIVEPEKIDYVICQHAEGDHAGALPEVLKAAPKAKVVCTRLCQEALSYHFHQDFDFQLVKTNDQLNLGENNLRFIEARMLHWPDNMFTYWREERILFSNDAFGGHLASSGRFEDEAGSLWMEEATKYFAVIVSVYSSIVKEKLREIEEMKLDLSMIAPAHGLIWRYPQKIIEAYKKWTSGQAGAKVTIVYDTMWQSTEKMAYQIARGFMKEGLEVKVFNLRSSDWTLIIKEIIDSRMFLIGSPTLNMGMYPSVGGFLTFLKGIRPVNKKAAAFGSFGWGKGAVSQIEEELRQMQFEVLKGLEIKYVPHQAELKACLEFGQKFALELKKGSTE